MTDRDHQPQTITVTLADQEQRRAEAAFIERVIGGMTQRAAEQGLVLRDVSLSDRIHEAGGIVRRSRDNIRKQRKQKRRRKGT